MLAERANFPPHYISILIIFLLISREANIIRQICKNDFIKKIKKIQNFAFAAEGLFARKNNCLGFGRYFVF